MAEHRTGRSIIRRLPTTVRPNGRRTVRIEVVMDEMAARMVATGDDLPPSEWNAIAHAIFDECNAAVTEMEDDR